MITVLIAVLAAQVAEPIHQHTPAYKPTSTEDISRAVTDEIEQMLRESAKMEKVRQLRIDACRAAANASDYEKEFHNQLKLRPEIGTVQQLGEICVAYLEGRGDGLRTSKQILLEN